MGQKTNQLAIGLEESSGWDSSWFEWKDFALKVVEDEKIRNYLNARISKAVLPRL